MSFDVAVFDLDSTLADTRARHHLTPTNTPSNTWVDYSLACASDTPIHGTIALARILDRSGIWIHVVSGRNADATALTAAWLDQHAVPHDVLRLKHPGDPEDNLEFKLAYLAKLKADGWSIRLVVEDWPPIAQAIQAIGIPVVCVNPCYGPVPMTQSL